MSIKRALAEKTGERGAIIVLFAMALVALVLFIALAVNASYVSLVRTELQTAADAAAFSAVQRLNSRSSGWADAREAAINTLSGFTARTGLSGTTSLTLDPDNETSEWDLTATRNLVARIQRGQWTQANGFISYEDDWQDQYPGIPAFAAANAVRVELIRPQVRALPSVTRGSAGYHVDQSAVALRGPVEPVCAPPFAIPICSLVDGNGELTATTRFCQGDRIFAKSSRYCPNGTPNCGKLPSSPYTMCSDTFAASPGGATFPQGILTPGNDQMFNGTVGNSTIGNITPHRQDPAVVHAMPGGDICYTLHGATNGNECDSWGWRHRQLFDDASDHFGVVGLPGTGAITEADVLAAMQDPSNTSGCVNAQIGQPYRVLHGGLTDPRFDAILWGLIATGGTPTAANIAYSSTPFGSMERHIELYEDYLSEDAAPTSSAGLILPDSDVSCRTPRRWKGICNSHRGRYVTATGSNGHINSAPLGHTLFYVFQMFSPSVPNPLTGSTTLITDQTTVWSVKIPVIAEVSSAGGGGTACKGLHSSSSDPAIDPSKQYLIVGFVQAMLYDVDIGNPPPRYNIKDMDESSVPFPIKLSFDESCNNTRGRIVCSDQFIPSSAANGYLVPRMVN